MSFFDPTGQTQSLTPNLGSGASQPVSANCIGNNYAISVGQSIPIIPQSDKPRFVWIFNVGLLPVFLAAIQNNIVPATTQKLWPDGMHIPCGDFYELRTSCTIYAAVPLFPRYFTPTPIFSPKALVSTAIEN